jgi:thymidine phosphorylase
MDGYVTAIDTERLGYVVIHLGGGRKQLTDKLDLSVGFEMLVRIGDKVEKGQPLAQIFAEPEAFNEVKRDFIAAVTIDDEKVDAPSLIVERIT